MSEFDISKIDTSKYEVSIKDNNPEDKNFDALLKHLMSVVLDRSIPEDQKLHYHAQLKELMRLKSITMQPPTIVLTPKESTPE
jgi:hypothetical protein